LTNPTVQGHCRDVVDAGGLVAIPCLHPISRQVSARRLGHARLPA